MSIQIWFIHDTDEIFTEYEKYLARYVLLAALYWPILLLIKGSLDFYKQVGLHFLQIPRASSLITLSKCVYTLLTPSLQRKFSCEITGHSQLTFFEAQNSEVG
jgi:hypothetical protein